MLGYGIRRTLPGEHCLRISIFAGLNETPRNKYLPFVFILDHKVTGLGTTSL